MRTSDEQQTEIVRRLLVESLVRLSHEVWTVDMSHFDNILAFTCVSESGKSISEEKTLCNFERDLLLEIDMLAKELFVESSRRQTYHLISLMN